MGFDCATRFFYLHRIAIFSRLIANLGISGLIVARGNEFTSIKVVLVDDDWLVELVDVLVELVLVV